MRVHSFESFGTVDGPGIRFVVFAQGCPMRCLYCHNPDTWEIGAGKEISVEEIAKEAVKYKSYFGANGGVTVSGGEPLLQIDELIKLFTILKRENIHTCLDTSGICFREGDTRYQRLLEVTDLLLLDIKHIGEEEHKKITGHSNAAPLAFAKHLSERGKPVWIRHVLVPELTDDNGALIRLREFLATLQTVEKVEVLPYHTMGTVKYQKLGIAYPLEGVESPSKERVLNAKNILQEKDL